MATSLERYYDAMVRPIYGNAYDDRPLLQSLPEIIQDEALSVGRRLAALRRYDMVLGEEKDNYSPEDLGIAIREIEAGS